MAWIRFSRDIRLGSSYYFGRAWYQVPDELAEQYQQEYPDIAMAVADELPGEERPVGQSVEADVNLEELRAQREAEAAAEAEEAQEAEEVEELSEDAEPEADEAEELDDADEADEEAPAEEEAEAEEAEDDEE